jgi:hypothetical protein
MMFVFTSHTFLTRGYSSWLFIPTLLAFCISSLETLLLQLHCDSVHERMGSILLVLAQRKKR